MKLYHVLVSKENNWMIGRVLEREGITTQGKTLDDLVFMIRDAIKLMWDETAVQLELVVPGESHSPQKSKPKKRPRLVQ
jgi:predicted RNase H-like HicB family nuclease